MGESILIVGGVRSGKSRLAEQLAKEQPPVTFVATAIPDETDPEMTVRIERHRASRPEDWRTMEVPSNLEVILADLAAREGTIVVDCVTLWLNNMMLGMGGGAMLKDSAILAAVGRAVKAGRGASRTIWVSNEVGMGIIPANAMARRFADLQGLSNQRIAAECDAVYFCAAGLSVRLK